MKDRKVGKKTAEVQAALEADSNFGKPKPARPTQEEVDQGLEGTGSIPPENLPPGVTRRGEGAAAQSTMN